MPKVKVPKKSTDTDMTPFVDVAFLILSFFIMATKFKPSEAVKITTPNSVSSQKLPDNNAVMVSMDKDSKVYFSILSKKDKKLGGEVIKRAAELRGIQLSDADVAKYQDGDMVGMPMNKMKSFLDRPASERAKVVQDGIPVLDSANNELVQWVQASKDIFASTGEPLKFLIKGDDVAKYPTFKAVVDALKKNDEQKYNLVTMPEDAPVGTDLFKERLGKKL